MEIFKDQTGPLVKHFMLKWDCLCIETDTCVLITYIFFFFFTDVLITHLYDVFLFILKSVKINLYIYICNNMYERD